MHVVLVKRRGREKGWYEVDGLKGKMKSLVEREKKMDLEAKLVAIVMMLGFGICEFVKRVFLVRMWILETDCLPSAWERYTVFRYFFTVRYITRSTKCHVDITFFFPSPGSVVGALAKERRQQRMQCNIRSAVKQQRWVKRLVYSN